MRSVLFVLLLCLTGCAEREDVIIFGEGSEAEREAMALLRERAEGGDADAATQLVFFTHWRTGDYAAALPELEALAERGSPAAARFLAIAYQHGRGVEPDFEGAARDLAAYEAFRAGRASGP